MSEQKAIRRANGQFKPGYKPPTAWEKGVSGNLDGRRGSLKDILDTIGDEVDDKGISTREQIMRKVTTMAKRGDMKAVQFIADRSEGRALERIEQHVTKDEIIIE